LDKELEKRKKKQKTLPKEAKRLNKNGIKRKRKEKNKQSGLAFIQVTKKA